MANAPLSAPQSAPDSASGPALRFGPVPAAEWDAWVMARPDSTPFHLNAWGEAVEAATGHRFERIGAWQVEGQGEQDGTANPQAASPDAAEGRLAGIVPAHFIRSRLFGKAMTSAGFAVGGGILAESQAVADALADHLWSRPDINASSAELRGGMLPSDGWRIDHATYAGFSRDLAADDVAELLAVPRKQRAEVRKALAALEAGDLAVVTGSDEAHAREHYAVYAESVRNLGTPVFPRRLFDEVRRRFGADADILTVCRADGSPLASVLSLYHRGVVMPYWGGGTWDARAARANELMYYKLMGHARARGCTRFDFGRSKTGTGPYAYKKNWGFEPQPLAYASRSPEGSAARDINPMSPKYQMQVRLWQKLPLWAANRIGPLIARGLG